MLIVTMFDGTEREVERYSYTVEEWYSGEWHVIGTFPGTKDGYKQAERLMNDTENYYVRIQQLY